MKRVVDLVLASVAIVAFAPIMVMAAIAVRVSSKGPVLYRQTRIGAGGREFSMLKFRSMVVNADSIGSYWTRTDDPRVTSVGKFIRRTSIDELPQLFNVLAGDMSVVGPRPDVPAQRKLYTDAEWQIRHQVRPGITGLAQATLRSSARPEERKRLDLEYAMRHSLALDLKIILLTVRQVLTKGGN